MGTTKLTRREILGEDPIHDAMVAVIDKVRLHAKTIVLLAGSLLLVAVGSYYGLAYLESRDMETQQSLGRAMDFYHARIDPTAPDDPFGKGSDPVFRTEEAKYRAASNEFSSVISKRGSSKPSVIAQYYLGLCQLHLGQKSEAIQSLEAVRNNTKDRTVGYLGKRVLARYYLESGNSKGARELLEGMIKDPQCELPKEELKLLLARAFLALGNREEAIKTLRQAMDDAAKSSLRFLLSQELSRIEGNSTSNPDGSKTANRP